MREARIRRRRVGGFGFGGRRGNTIIEDQLIGELIGWVGKGRKERGMSEWVGFESWRGKEEIVGGRSAMLDFV